MIDYRKILQRQDSRVNLNSIIRNNFLAFDTDSKHLLYSEDGASYFDFYNSGEIDSKFANISGSSIKSMLDPSVIPVLPSQLQIASTGDLTALTAGQQAQIGQGTVVTTTDGLRWVYSGTGSKTLAASYIQLADITPDWSTISNKPTNISTWTNDSGYLTNSTGDNRYLKLAGGQLSGRLNLYKNGATTVDRLTHGFGFADAYSGIVSFYGSEANAINAINTTGVGASDGPFLYGYRGVSIGYSSVGTQNKDLVAALRTDLLDVYVAGNIKEGGTFLNLKYLGINSNAVSATKLQTARTINGVSFDGTANISFTTDSVAEGTTNKYYTDTRARAALSVSAPLTYNSSTGAFAITQATTSTNGYLSSTDWNTFNGKLNLSSVLTGYAVGTNAALAATDSILAAFGKTQAQINSINSNFSNYSTKAVADTLYLGISANAVSATKLATARTIAGVSFDGTANISIPYANLTGLPTLGTLAAKSSVAWGTDITGIPSTFTPSAHTHSSLTNTGIAPLSSAAPSVWAIPGLDVRRSTNTGAYPYAYGNILSLAGDGVAQIQIGMNTGASPSNTSMYFRNSRDVVDSFSTWARVLDTASDASSITNWNSAYSWGNHASAGYSLNTHTHTFASLTSKPTTLSGYGITDAATSTHTHTFASLTSKPTTIAGYGITDALAYRTNNNNGVSRLYRRDASDAYYLYTQWSTGNWCGNTWRILGANDQSDGQSGVFTTCTSYADYANILKGVSRSSDGGQTIFAASTGSRSAISNGTSSCLINRYEYSGWMGFIGGSNEFFGITQDHNLTGGGAELSIIAGASTGHISFFAGAPTLLENGCYQAPLVGNWTNSGLSITGNLTVSGNLNGNAINNFVQGSNVTRSTRATSLNTINQSGFYDGSNLAGSPSGSWDHIIHKEHNDNNGYSLQIQCDYFGDNFRFRRNVASNWQGWKTVWHDGNLNQNCSTNQSPTFAGLTVNGTISGVTYTTNRGGYFGCFKPGSLGYTFIGDSSEATMGASLYTTNCAYFGNGNSTIRATDTISLDVNNSSYLMQLSNANGLTLYRSGTPIITTSGTSITLNNATINNGYVNLGDSGIRYTYTQVTGHGSAASAPVLKYGVNAIIGLSGSYTVYAKLPAVAAGAICIVIGSPSGAPVSSPAVVPQSGYVYTRAGVSSSALSIVGQRQFFSDGSNWYEC